MQTATTNSRNEMNGAIAASRTRLALRRSTIFNYGVFRRGGLVQNRWNKRSETKERWATKVAP